MPSARLAVPVVALSVISDLAKGFDEGSALRTAVLAVRIADRLGLDQAGSGAAYWVALLRFTGCTATAAEMASELDDEIAVSAAFAAVDPTDLRAVVATAARLHPGEPGKVLQLLIRAPGVIERHEIASCEVAGLLARGLGLPEAVISGLTSAFERYDGKGHPGSRRGESIPLPTRVAQAAQLAELIAPQGPVAVAAALRKAAGRALDPALAELVAAHAAELVDGLAEVGPAEAFAAEPGPQLFRDETQYDDAARAMGAVVDLKSGYLAGHSQRVATLAAAAGVRAGLAADEVVALRRAGWLHDVGRAGVSSRIWDKPGPLTAAEWEKVRMHPYLSRRVLSQVSEWAVLAELAGRHHERLDGSGYPDGVTGSVGVAAAILAAADHYCTLTEARPHRPALTPAAARQRLLVDVGAGRLDRAAVAAVLDQDAAPERPVVSASGLTSRELEVLALLGRGLTNRAVGSRLGISAKTVNTHLEHLYAKLGVSCRAAAVFHAAQAGLL